MAGRAAFILVLLSVVGGGTPRASAQDVPPFPSGPPLNFPRPSVTSFQFPPPPTLPADPKVDLPPSSPPPPATIPLPKDEVFLPEGSKVVLPAGAKRQLIRYSPRYGTLNKFDLDKLPDGTQRLVYTSGLIINVVYEIDGPPGQGVVPQEFEFAADNLVMWIKNLNGKGPADGLPLDQPPDGTDGGRLELELFMTGNVVIRSKDEQVSSVTGGRTVTTRTLRAEQIYYDVNKNKAVALRADLEMHFGNFQDSVHLFADRMDRLGRSEWQATKAGAFSSRLPSDPALELLTSSATLRERETDRRNIFGIRYRKATTGEVDYSYERTLIARNARIELLGVPIFYTPYLQTDPSQPLGPLKAIGYGNDRMFGSQIYTTWDLYNLFALRPPVGHSWRLNVDYLDKRGPAGGSDYSYVNPDFFGFFGPNKGFVRLYGVSDRGADVLGGNRGPEPVQSQDRNGDKTFFRGRAIWRNQQEILADRDRDGVLTDGPYLTLQNQFAHQSDKNFFEQYYKQEFQTGPNQETFAYLSGSTGRVHGSLLVQDGQDRNWMTETRWLPQAKAALLGQSFFDTFTYNSKVDAGYANFRPSQVSPFPVLATEQKAIDTGRLDWWQELSAPLDAGPFKVVPYGVFDLTGYSQDLNGDSRGRVYGGGGARASITFSRLFTEASNELFNVRGLNHKATFHSNYYIARTNVHYTDLPQLDRLDDDAIDFTYRNITPFQTTLVKGPGGVALASAPFFDPQQLAIRRLVDSRVDTRDDVQVVQLGLDQRLQTKRGAPGREHTIDWLTFDLSTSLFPQASKDNYGKTAAFFEYNTVWNVGDQTAVTSSGWFDPFSSGARYWNVGAYFNRPDRTNFFIGYRETDPVNSKAVTANVGYQLTRKYGVNVSTSYDFGTQQALSNQFLVTRTGTDLTVTIGLTYNQVTNTTGFTFSIVPNIAAASGFTRFGTPQIGGNSR